jgi:hypothetical protein
MIRERNRNTKGNIDANEDENTKQTENGQEIQM